MAKKHDPEFQKFFASITKLNKTTGSLSFDGAYVYLGVNVSWNGTVVSTTYANAVWFMTHGRWPNPGMVIDHINDDPLDNRPENLQELTQPQNHAKRRGRIVYRSYGKGKYGYGIGVYHDKRDGRYYVDRHMSRGHGKGDLKGIRISFGGFDTKLEAEAKIKECIKDIELNGLDYMPPNAKKRPKKTTVELDAATQKMREMRAAGQTIKQISEVTGLTFSAVYNRIRDVKVN